MRPLLTVLLLLLLLCSGAASEDKGAGAANVLKEVMRSTISGLSKMRSIVKEYERQLNDTQTLALLADCLDLTSECKHVVKESLSIIDKLNISSSSASDENSELIRTNLSAALTDMTTCTDGLDDELTEESERTKAAVSHIEKQAAKVSLLLSRALRLIMP